MERHITVEMWNLHNSSKAVAEEHKIAAVIAQNLHKKAELLRNKLASVCSHPVLLTKTRYLEGGYNDRSSTTYWTECDFCGSKVGSDRVVHGGFA